MPDGFKLDSRAGAFGRWWRVFDEVSDPRVERQTTPVSCHSACGELLSEGLITQAELLEVLGKGLKSPPALLAALESFGRMRFLGGDFPLKVQRKVLTQIPFIAFVFAHDQGSLHAVLVEGYSGGRLTLLDPWDGTKYDVLEGDFFDKMWIGMAIWREQP